MIPLFEDFIADRLLGVSEFFTHLRSNDERV